MADRRTATGFCAVFPRIFVCAVVIVLFGAKSQATEAGNSPDKVKVSVYYESLCGSSRYFINRQLYPTWKDLRDIMTIELYAYGKAREVSPLSFTCQHGQNECKGNIMLACAKKYIQDFEEFFSFTNCVMEAYTGHQAGQTCAAQVGVDFTPIGTCSAGDEGLQLLHDVGTKQSALRPKVNYVPWILINDVYSTTTRRESERDLRKVVCRKYRGPKPAACF